MATVSNKELKDRGLTRSQFEALERSTAANGRGSNDAIPRVRHVENGLGFGAASSSIGVLSRNGYISLELVHTSDEVASLNARKDTAIANAKQALDEGDWKGALVGLSTASKLEAATETRRWKLTDKALRTISELTTKEEGE